MPFRNFHANRLRSPDLFDSDSFRTTRGGVLFGGNLKVPNTINIIWGKLKGSTATDDPVILQSLQFRKSRWTVATAKAWIQKNIGGRGIFEPASNLSEENTLSDKQIEEALAIGDLTEYNEGEAITLEDLKAINYNIEFDESEDVGDTAIIAAQLHQLNAELEGTTTNTTSAASESLAEEDSDEAETQNLKDIEIFQAGTWKDVKYTTKDLDEIAANFIKWKDRIKPPVKLGHNEEQELTQKDGMPAAGWITNLKRVGDKLVADISDVPRKIAKIVKNRGYARISSEIYTNLQDSQGTKHGKVLKAIAFLGGDIPHLKSLDDIVAQYDTSLLDNEYRSVIFMADDLKKEVNEETTEEETTETTDETKDETQETEEKTEDTSEEEEEEKVDDTTEDEEITTDDEVDLKAELAEMREANKALETANKTQAADLKIATGLISNIQKEREQEKTEKNLLSDEAFLDGLTQEGKFPPAAKSKAIALLTEVRKAEESVVTYSEGEDEIQTDILGLVKSLFSEWPQGMSFGETATGSSIAHPKGMGGILVNRDGIPIEGEDLDKQVKKYMENSGEEDYGTALLAVSKANS